MCLGDERLSLQLERLENFLCIAKLCEGPEGSNLYRFPHCAGFLRPTDRLQRPNQKFVSTGEHLPICKIGECSTLGPRGGKILRYQDIRNL